MSFQSNPNLIKLAREVYVYKNFLSEEEILKCQKAISQLNEQHWLNLGKYDNNSEIPAPNQVFQGHSDLDLLYEKSVEFFGPEYAPLPSNGVSRMIEGQSLEVHWDSPGHPDDQDVEALSNFMMQKDSPKNEFPLYDPLDTCHIVQYGYVVYVNDFEGGELYYPEWDLEYKPEKGDLVIHSSSKKFRHGVRPVKSGPRYAYTNFITKSEHMPMSLDEYKQKSDDLMAIALEKNNNAPTWTKR